MNFGGSGGGSSQGGTPIAKGFGFTVLIALVALLALRQLFGSIRIEAGAR
jgi:hypothetical protein